MPTHIKQIKLNKISKPKYLKIKIVLGLCLVILVLGLLIALFKAISGWYDTHTVKFNQIIQIHQLFHQAFEQKWIAVACELNLSIRLRRNASTLALTAEWSVAMKPSIDWFWIVSIKLFSAYYFLIIGSVNPSLYVLIFGISVL